jgi:hypothetical protein
MPPEKRKKLRRILTSADTPPPDLRLLRPPDSFSFSQAETIPPEQLTRCDLNKHNRHLFSPEDLTEILHRFLQNPESTKARAFHCARFAQDCTENQKSRFPGAQPTARPAELRPETLRRSAHRPADDAGHFAPIRATAAADDLREALDDQPGHGAQLSTIRRSGDQISPSRSAGRRFRPNGDNSAQRFDRMPEKPPVFVWKWAVDFPKRRRAAACIHSVSNLYTKAAHRLEQSEAVFLCSFSQFCHKITHELRILHFELRQMFICGNSGTRN